ncbi:MAG: hypothetical protein GY948_00505, partial [Alphaproteobacteria bacterium]|nr:hypothetical protein [Alphaproteobacteria bacterium]
PEVPLDGVRMARKCMFFDSSRAIKELGYEPTPVEAALERAVAWYRDNPPSVTEKYAAELAENYRLEDEIAAVYRQSCEALAAIEPEAKDFHHPYPHPKKPGLNRDHRAR